MSSSPISSQGVVLATAMAVSGTVILLAFRLQKSHTSPPTHTLRSCISSEAKKRQGKKKRVHFADDVVDSNGDGREFRRNQKHRITSSSSSSSSYDNDDSVHESKVPERCNNGVSENRGRMPANRLALYNGILRDRVAQRLTYSY